MIQAGIRKYQPRDRGQVRDIFYDSAMLGEPAAAFFDGKEIIQDALTLYFTDHEPESSFVAEKDGVVIGALVGAKDRRAAENFVNRFLLPRILWKAFCQGVFLRPKNLNFIIRGAAGALKGEFSSPDFYGVYPAVLHINLKKEFRRSGVGGMLMRQYLDYLVEENIRGVSLATMSEQAADFFQGQGFKLLFRGKRSYFRHILKKDVPLFIYGRTLP